MSLIHFWLLSLNLGGLETLPRWDEVPKKTIRPKQGKNSMGTEGGAEWTQVDERATTIVREAARDSSQKRCRVTRVATAPLIFDSNCLPLPESELF